MRAETALLCLLLLASPGAPADSATVAFGSCLRQWKPVPILDAVRDLQPDLFVFAGDNVYTDNGPYRLEAEPGRIETAYLELAARPEYRALRDAVPILATWDDHDYGRNNAGAEYPWKQQSREQFLKFFSPPDSAPVRQRPGVYSTHEIMLGERRIHLVLLDTRSFRSPLQEAAPDESCPGTNLVPTADRSATLLGARQWEWLEQRLREPAALRLIVSSIQVIPDGHCYEKWGNFPRERERLLELIEASGVRTVILSGDRHLGEISRLTGSRHALPLYEITASGLNSAGAGKGELNPYRLFADNVRVDHFGSVRFQDSPAELVELSLHDSRGAPVQRLRLDYAPWQPLDVSP